MTFSLASPAFSPDGNIPARHTCEGEDVSPPLAWSDAPEGTQCFVLIVDDPDAPDPAAPRMVWVHWVLYNIPGRTRDLPEAASAATLPAGTLEGANDWKRRGYGGPCPPVGRHRYFFKLYALDTVLADLAGPSKARVERAMASHVLGEAALVGTYRKKRA